MTGESWSETIARPMVVGSSSSADGSGASVGLFYVFFILLMQVVLTNVVVAVRLCHGSHSAQRHPHGIQSSVLGAQ
jgi:hypothetical protein